MLTIKSSVFLKKLQRFFSVLETACQADHAAPPSPYPQQWVYLPPIQRLAAGGDFTLKVSVSICRLRRPENAVPTAGAKGGKGTVWFPCPLLTPPPTLLCAATPFGRAAKRELRRLGSGRRFAYGTLSGPEVSLRKPQRYQCAAIRCRAQTPSLRPPDMGQACPRRKKSTDLHLCSFG